MDYSVKMIREMFYADEETSYEVLACDLTDEQKDRLVEFLSEMFEEELEKDRVERAERLFP